MKEYWQNAVTYEEYLKNSEQKITQLANSKDEEEQTYHNYYELGYTRMLRVNKTFRPSEEHLEKLKNKNFKGRILIISEGWCGDAAMIIPVVNKFFEKKNEVKITYRDQNDLIDQFLTNGTQSIPIVIFLDENEKVVAHWGPRPKHGIELLKQHKEKPEGFNKELFHNELQIYYTKNKGKDIIDELLEKI